MNVYDFDETIYKKDCSYTFYFWCLKHQPLAVVKHWPQLASAFIAYKRGKIIWARLMENLFSYLTDLQEVEKEVERFWDVHAARINAWYPRQQRVDDVVISASPDFLVKPGARRLGIEQAMGSPLNPQTGLYEGYRRHGEGKVTAFYEVWPDGQVDEFYSDSLSDTPLAAEAKRAFLVKGETLTPWPEDSLKAYVKE